MIVWWVVCWWAVGGGILRPEAFGGTLMHYGPVAQSVRADDS
jgi:hypothetical protein